MKKSNRIFKVIAVTVILALVINLLPDIFGINKVMAAENGGNNSESGVEVANGIIEVLGEDGETAIANIPYTQELRKVSDGYELKLTIDPTVTYEAANTNRTKSTNGYFTADITGDYLIEIFGGKGGGYNVLGYGKGGDGGHVYGVVHLNAGDTLLYSIGGNGGVVRANKTGGSNGGAGNEEDNYFVGSGGGYTAVYLFNKEEINIYLNNAGENLVINEADRQEKEIMVAGGGGGGGSRDKVLLNKRYADGGAGGNMNSITVPGFIGGVVFTGANGVSSGDNSLFVGEGGSDNPGDAVTSNAGNIISYTLKPESSEAGKSWKEGGQGGLGCLGGGGGGAGYCGGSGGAMQSPSDSSNIGGGGGGSSFIKDKVNDVKINYVFGDDDIARRSLLSPEDINSIKNNDDTGGIFHIANLNYDKQLDFLKDVSINCSFSEYFDVKLNEEVLKDNVLNINNFAFINEDNSTKKISSEKLELALVFSPKKEFAGGNDVPLINNNNITMSFSNGINPVNFNVADNCAYVNVPLTNFGVNGETVDFDLNTNSLPTIKPSDLIEKSDAYDYHNRYFSTDAENTWRYAFIDSVSGYTVGEYSDNELETTVLASSEKLIDETKRYDISFTVNPNTIEFDKRKAKIGEYQEPTTYSSIGTIRLVDIISGELNGDSTKDIKTLIDNGDGTYTLRFESSVMYNKAPTEKTNSSINNNTTLHKLGEKIESGEPLFPGYYYVYIKGGNGGAGSNIGGRLDADQGKGGKGGNGAAFEKIIEVTEQDEMTYVIGEAGQTMAYVYGEGGGNGGYGGQYSKISIGENTTIFAGGGGGGGGAYAEIGGYILFVPYYNVNEGDGGLDGESDGNICQSEITKYNGTNGVNGFSLSQKAKGGEGGKSYLTGKIIDYSDAIKDDAFKSNTYLLNAHNSDHTFYNNKKAVPEKGNVIIIPIQYFDKEYTFDNLDTTYSFETQISPYFEVVKDDQSKPCISINQTIGNDKVSLIDSTSEFSMSAMGDSISICNYRLDPTSIIPTGTINSNSELNGPLSYTVEIKLKPIDGFLGGNDVPIFKVLDDGSTSGKKVYSTINISQKDSADEENGNNSYSVEADETTDFANVKLNLDAINGYLNSGATSQENPFTVSNIEYIIGFDSLDFTDICKETKFADVISDFCGDFVTIKDVTKPDNFNTNPTEAQNPGFTFSVEPIDSPRLAVVGPECEEYSLTKYSKIDVKSGIKFVLENVTVDGLDSIKGEFVDEPDILWNIANTYDYTCKFIPSKNYTLPKTVKISYKVTTGEGVDITSECSYDYVSGELIIPYYELKSNSVLVEVHAVAPDEKFNVTYIYPSIKEEKGIKSIDEDNPIIIVDNGVLKDGETEPTGYSAGDRVYDLTNTNRLYPGTTTLTTIKGKIGEDDIDINLPIIPESIKGYDFEWISTVDDMLIGMWKCEKCGHDGNVSAVCLNCSESRPIELSDAVKMPAKNLRVMGSYVPKNITLKINYLDKAGNILHEPYSSLVKVDEDAYISSLKFGDSYSVECPVIAGYKAVDKDGKPISSVSGEITDDKNIEITVYYESTQGELILNFLNEDGSTAYESVDINLNTDDEFYVDLTNRVNNTLNGLSDSSFSERFEESYLKTGYDIIVTDANGTDAITDRISGKMTAQGAIYNVRFVGKAVKVFFDTRTTEVTKPNDITVQYNNIMGYVIISSSKEYKPLPLLYRNGYSFIGWQKANGQMVSETTVVDSTEDITLYAVWESVDFTVTINFVGRYYQGEEGKEKLLYKSGFIEKSKEISGNKNSDELLVELPTIAGYMLGNEYVEAAGEPDSKYCSENGKYYIKVKTDSNRSETIYYDLQKYQITIYYKDEKGNDVKSPLIDKVYFDDSYSYMSPNPEAIETEDGEDPFNSVSMKSITGRMSVPDNPEIGLVFTITYFRNTKTPIISVIITWEPLEFEYSRGEWNPETHSYADGTFKPNGSEAPKITVSNSNESNVNIKAELSFEVIKSYSGINVTLSNPIMDGIVPGAAPVTSTINLSGRMGDDVTENEKLPVGSVKVKITRISSPKS